MGSGVDGVGGKIMFFYKENFENHTSGGSYVVVMKDDIWDDHVNIRVVCQG